MLNNILSIATVVDWSSMDSKLALEDLRQPLADIQDAFSTAFPLVAEFQETGFENPIDLSLYSHLVRAKVRDVMMQLGYSMSFVANTGLELVGESYRMKILKMDSRGLNRKATSPSRRTFCMTSETLPPVDGSSPDGFWGSFVVSEADGKTHFILEWQKVDESALLYLSETESVERSTGRIKAKWRSKVDAIYVGGKVFVPADEDIELFVTDTEEGLAVGGCGR